MASLILHFHLVANPLGSETFVFFVPETFFVGYVGMATAPLVFGTSWTISVHTLGRVARFGASTAFIAGLAA